MSSLKKLRERMAMTKLAEKTAQGKRAMALAKARGYDTAAWEARLGELEVVEQRLQKAIKQKIHEIGVDKRKLDSPYYANHEGIKERINCLHSHIGEIERYLSDGGELSLPSCYRKPEHICELRMDERKPFQCSENPAKCQFMRRET